jgi:uncharacterized BrkB/YihY/UPF0761 family membrane protein
MKRTFTALLIFSGIVFLSLIAHAGLAPAQFAHSNFLLVLFRISGVGVFLAIVYGVIWFYREGVTRTKKKLAGRQ